MTARSDSAGAAPAAISLPPSMTNSPPLSRRVPEAGFSAYFALKFTLVWLQRWGKVLGLGLLGRRPKFVVLSPPFLGNQYIFDPGRRTLLHVRIRNVVDFCTLSEIFWDRAYDLGRLARGAEIAAYYDQLVAAGAQPLIVDCGANMGLAARYFAHDFPAARIIAIEPDESNVRQARLNNDAAQVEIRQAAVASAPMQGRIVDLGRGNNALQVEADEGGALEMISLNSILAGAEAAGQVPFMVKIDIEGFERELFSRNLEWLDRFPVLVIELHDWLMPGQGTSRNFLRAIAGLDRDFVYINENVFSISNRLGAARAATSP
jgi:FkbM family methyltransferase